MSLRFIGSILIVAGTSCCGFSTAIQFRQEERMLRQLHEVIQNMQCELSYHLTPLPELVEHGSAFASGSLKTLLIQLADNLQRQSFPDAECCLRAALEDHYGFSMQITELLYQLSRSLGRFDLSGQLKGFEELQSLISQASLHLRENRELRLRSYCTLGICAGIALAILLF